MELMQKNQCLNVLSMSQLHSSVLYSGRKCTCIYRLKKILSSISENFLWFIFLNSFRKISEGGLRNQIDPKEIGNYKFLH